MSCYGYTNVSKKFFLPDIFECVGFFMFYCEVLYIRNILSNYFQFQGLSVCLVNDKYGRWLFSVVNVSVAIVTPNKEIFAENK